MADIPMRRALQFATAGLIALLWAPWIVTGSVAQEAGILLAVEDHRVADELLGESAPADTNFLIVTAALTNQLDKPLVLPALSHTMALRLAPFGSANLHPLSRYLPRPGWGSLSFEPGQSRRVDLAFLVPNVRDKAPAGAMLVYQLPEIVVNASVYGDPSADPDEMARAEGRLASIALHAVRVTDRAAGLFAPVDRRFMMLDVTVRRQAGHVEPQSIARMIRLVEDGAFVHAPHATTAKLSPQFTDFTLFPSGFPASGTLVFEVPVETGALVLRMATRAGTQDIPLSDRPVPALPPALAGPGGDGGQVAARLLGVRLLDSPSDSPHRVVVADMLLELAAETDGLIRFDTASRVHLIGPDWRRYRPVDFDDFVHRPLGMVDLWAGQPTRGEVAFVVPSQGGSDYLLEITGASGLITLPVTLP